MLGKARRGPLIPSVVSERLYMGERDPGIYPEFLCGCKRPEEIPRISMWGVRDLGRYPKFLCGCKRPGEKSEISVWV